MTPETREIINQSIEIAILKSHATKPEWFSNHEQADTREFVKIRQGIEEIKATNFNRGAEYAKTVNELAKISSHNSGQIVAIWESLKKDQAATKLIADIASFGKITKWIAFLIIGFGALYSSIKSGVFLWFINIFK